MKKTVYAAIFFFTIHYALALYVNSSFLGSFLPEWGASLALSAGSFLAIAGLGMLPRAIARWGQYRTTLAILCVSFASTLLLGMRAPVGILLAAFLLFYALEIVVGAEYDIYLEKFSKDKETGRIRGIYLTVINFGVLIAPAIAGQLVPTVEGNAQDFTLVYLVSALCILPTLAITAVRLRRVEDARTDRAPFWRSFASVRRRPDLFRVFMARFLLEFFYAWMILYTPIFLTRAIGFSWQEIGAMFPIMLLPFVLFEFPLGKLADAALGEKEIMSAGFVVVAFFSGSLAFVTGKNFLLWTSLLFLTRVGASAIEIMTESYFFKQVNAQDTNAISLFRDTRPLALALAPLAAGAVLTVSSYATLYLVLGFLMLSGLCFSLPLHDTR